MHFRIVGSIVALADECNRRSTFQGKRAERKTNNFVQKLYNHKLKIPRGDKNEKKERRASEKKMTAEPGRNIKTKNETHEE